MAQLFKVCPHCQEPASLTALDCAQCGRIFQTTAQPTAVFLRNDDPNPSFERTIKWSVVTMAVCVVIIAGIFVHNKYEAEISKAQIAESIEKAQEAARAQSELDQRNEREFDAGLLHADGYSPSFHSQSFHSGGVETPPAPPTYDPNYHYVQKDDPLQGTVTPEEIRKAQESPSPARNSAGLKSGFGATRGFSGSYR